MHIRPYPLENPDNAYLNALGAGLNNNKFKSGKGIKITSHNNSHIIEHNKEYANEKMRFIGTFDPSAEYFENDVVVVSSSISGSTSGTYVCVNYVPPQIMDSTLLIGTVAAQVASWGGVVTEDWANGYRHNNNNVYYPTTQVFTPITGVVENTWTVTASQSFWQILGGSSGDVTLVQYNPVSTYLPSQMVYVQPWDDASLRGYYNYNSMVGNSASAAIKTSMPGTYLCLAATSPQLNTTTGSIFSGSHGVDIPTYPPVNNSWQIVAPWPNQHYVITSLLNKDYYYARTYTITGSNISVGSTNIPVAKSARYRISNNIETIDGVNITYASSTSGSIDNYRLASDGTNYELQVVFPRFTSYPMTSSATPYNKTEDMGIITAYVPFTGTDVPLTGTDLLINSTISASVYLEEMLPHRVWAKRYIQ